MRGRFELHLSDTPSRNSPLASRLLMGRSRCRTAIYTAKLTRFADRVSTFN